MPLLRDLERSVEFDLQNCIGCHHCIDVCPVLEPGQVTMGQVKEALWSGGRPAGAVETFTYDCVQCDECVPVCPTSCSLAGMVLLLKSRAPLLPEHHRYFRTKGTTMTLAGRLGLRFLKMSSRRSLPKMHPHIDRRPETLRRAPLLFYAGCYAYMEAAEMTLDLLDHAKADYEVLAGTRPCCGWPQLLAGRLDEAEEMLDLLLADIRRVEPETVVTGCAECYAALKLLVRVKGARFRPVTTTEWLRDHWERFPVKASREILAFHEACHISRKEGEADAGRDLLSRLGQVAEFPQNRDEMECCGYYSFDVSPRSRQMRDKKFADARALGASTLVTECVACQHKFHPEGKERGVEVVDLVEMVHSRVFGGRKAASGGRIA